MSTPSVPSLDAAALPRASPPAREVPRFGRAILACALGFGVLAECLFDGHALGISFPLAFGALLGGLLWVGGREGRQQARANLWLAAPMLFFAGAVAVRESPVLTALNVLAALGLLLLFTEAYAGEQVHAYGLPRYFSATVRALGGWLSRPRAVVATTVDLRSARDWAAPRARPVARGLALAVPVLFLFGGLLSAADSRFEALLGRLLSSGAQGGIATAVGRALWVLGGAFIAAGALAHGLRRKALAAPERRAALPGGLGFVEGATLLVCVDLLFGLFGVIQFAYLFGGSAHLAEADLTYATYARHGFFELLAVAVLSLGLIHALVHVVARGALAQRRLFNALCTAMVACVVVILVSAILRMSLYEEAYGYTRLRVYTHVFMLTLIPLLSWRAITLWTRVDRFALGLFAAGLVCVGALDVLNPDAFIASRNLARGAVTGTVDVGYLASLSSDALPTLGQALADGRLGGQAEALREALWQGEARPSTDDASWPAFHLGRHRARRAFPELTRGCP